MNAYLQRSTTPVRPAWRFGAGPSRSQSAPEALLRWPGDETDEDNDDERQQVLPTVISHGEQFLSNPAAAATTPAPPRSFELHQSDDFAVARPTSSDTGALSRRLKLSLHRAKAASTMRSTSPTPPPAQLVDAGAPTVPPTLPPPSPPDAVSATKEPSVSAVVDEEDDGGFFNLASTAASARHTTTASNMLTTAVLTPARPAPATEVIPGSDDDLDDIDDGDPTWAEAAARRQKRVKAASTSAKANKRATTTPKTPASVGPSKPKASTPTPLEEREPPARAAAGSARQGAAGASDDPISLPNSHDDHYNDDGIADIYLGPGAGTSARLDRSTRDLLNYADRHRTGRATTPQAAAAADTFDVDAWSSHNDGFGEYDDEGEEVEGGDDDDFGEDRGYGAEYDDADETAEDPVAASAVAAQAPPPPLPRMRRTDDGGWEIIIDRPDALQPAAPIPFVSVAALRSEAARDPRRLDPTRQFATTPSAVTVTKRRRGGASGAPAGRAWPPKRRRGGNGQYFHAGRSGRGGRRGGARGRGSGRPGGNAA